MLSAHKISGMQCKENIFKFDVELTVVEKCAFFQRKTSHISLNYKYYVRIKSSVIISVRERKFSGTKVP